MDKISQPERDELNILVRNQGPVSYTHLSAEPDAEVQSADAGTVDTVVYYQDNYGYLVPVQCKVPAEDGIAKATLSLMVKSTANDMQAARLGLRTVLPENISIDLDIADGLARIDLGKEALDMPDAAAESNMKMCIRDRTYPASRAPAFPGAAFPDR